jgi:UMF1 family MFS transporter
MAIPVTGTPSPPTGYADRRERVSWYAYDWACSVFSTSVLTVFLGPYLGSVADRAAGPDGLVRPLGIPVAAGSYYAYLVSLSVLLTVVVLPVTGAIADRSPHKKRLLAGLAFTGAAATTLLLFASGDRYLLGGLLFLAANIGFGASIVIYYSYLPQLSAPDRRDAVSSIGWAIGYLGGGLLLAVHVAVVAVGGAAGWDTGTMARWCIASAGWWWAAFTVVPMLGLRDRPSPAGTALGNPVTDGFRQLGHTLRDLRNYPLTLAFLAAYLLYNDGIQTVISLAAVYGSAELRLPQSVLASTILLVQFVAIGGALLLGVIARRVGARPAVLGSLVVWVAVLGLAYLLPAGKVLPFVALGGLIGLVLGGSQALSRSMFSQLIPAGREAEYFGLYEISDKGTSWLGPLLFGLAFQVTGSYRVAIVSLVVFFLTGFAGLFLVPIRRAVIAAGNVPPELI